MASEFQTNLCSELRDNWVKCIFGRLISCVKPQCGIQDDRTTEDVIKAQLSKLTNLPQVPLRDGQIIGKWIVLHGLGEGAFGKTFLLKNRKLGSFVCVKTVDMKNHQTLTGNAKLRYVRFVQKECQLHLSLDHPNIIKLYHGVFGKRFVYLFMEYAPNTFLDLISGLPGGKLQLADARKYFRQLISAVKYLHELGIAHRDIKPDNLLLDVDGQLQLADFGEATLFRHGVREQFMMNVRGTEPYMAPEMFSQDAYRAPAADIWACAITLITLLSGKFPWEKAEAKDPHFAYWKATGGQSRLDKYLDPETKEFLRFLMAVDPDQRPSAAKIEEHPWLKV